MQLVPCTGVKGGRPLTLSLTLQTEALLQNLRVSLSVVAISNSKKMILSSEPLQKLDWQQQLGEEVRLNKLSCPFVICALQGRHLLCGQLGSI
jgi:hypothetical protein